MKIFLSPSSQYDNKYNYGNHTEGEVCRLIAEKVQDLLCSSGVDCKIGSNTSMYDRVKESNDWKPDFHVCIHTNASNGNAHGTEVFVYNTVSYPPEASKVLANLVKLTGCSRGIKSGSNLYECKATYSKAIYLECEFHDCVDKAHGGQWIWEHMNDIAYAIASAFCDCTEHAENLSQDNNSLWRVQLGAFTTKERAEAYARELKTKYGLETYVRI